MQLSSSSPTEAHFCMKVATTYVKIEENFVLTPGPSQPSFPLPYLEMRNEKKLRFDPGPPPPPSRLEGKKI